MFPMSMARRVKPARARSERGGRIPNSTTARSGLGDGDDEADGGQDVAHADALDLGRDLDDRLARVVHLPGELPTALLRAPDRLHELRDDLLEGMAIAVVEDGHPRRIDGGVGPLDLLDLRRFRGMSWAGSHRDALSRSPDHRPFPHAVPLVNDECGMSAMGSRYRLAPLRPS